MPSSKKYKILFVTSEVVPFMKTGGLADVSSALTQKLTEMGHQVRIVVPKYGAIDERKYKIHEVVRLKDLKTNIGDKEVTFSLRSSFLVGQKARVQIYFLDNQEYFVSRHSLYNDPLTGEDFHDNDERFILLNKCIFELITKLGWIPDIIHCNDWQGALIPAYLKTIYKNNETFKHIKTIFTIHNLVFQGIFPKSAFAKTGLPDQLNSDKGIIHNNKVNFLKAGLQYADIISTVSETYAKEICSIKELGYGLHELLAKRKKDIRGIANGIDETIWNPEKDKLIPKTFSIKSIADKVENKKALCESFGFPVDEKTPLIGIISRLIDVKGTDLLQKTFPEIMKLKVRVVLLGTGEKKYQKYFEDFASKHSDKFSCYIGFDEKLAHLVEAGSDMLLIPSKSEPCGLNQMYSQVYGTPPIVHKTGGLADTVSNFTDKNQDGNGFVFEKYDSKEMIKEIKRAVDLYTDEKATWLKVVKNGMKATFSWSDSTKHYIDLYKKLAE